MFIARFYTITSIKNMKVSEDRTKLVNWVDSEIDGSLSFEYFPDNIKIYCKGIEIGIIEEIGEIK